MSIIVVTTLICSGLAFYGGYEMGHKRGRERAQAQRKLDAMRARRRLSKSFESLISHDDALRQMRGMSKQQWNAFFFHAKMMSFVEASPTKLATSMLHASGLISDGGHCAPLSMVGLAIRAHARRLANKTRYWPPEIKRNMLAPYLQVTNRNHPALDAILWLAEQKDTHA